MLRRQEFYDRRCVAGLMQVVEQVPLRAEVRGAFLVDDTSTGLLLLWSLLRWERTFAIRTLESMGVDLWSLTRATDEALKVCVDRGRESRGDISVGELNAHLRKWLDRAAEEARAMQHSFVGSEHLLLALLARDAPPFAAIFQGGGLTYDALKQAIVAAFSQAVPPSPAAPPQPAVAEVRSDEPVTPVEIAAKPAAADYPPGNAEARSWVAEFDRPAVGVPRRFGVFLMMLIVTFYAVLFSALRVLHATPLIFALMALLFTGIGIGQAVLFGGRYPRAASIWCGAILLPIEGIAFGFFKNDFLYFGDASLGKTIAASIAIVIIGFPLGAILGYLFGTLTASGFYLVDSYEKRHPRG